MLWCCCAASEKEESLVNVSPVSPTPGIKHVPVVPEEVPLSNPEETRNSGSVDRQEPAADDTHQQRTAIQQDPAAALAKPAERSGSRQSSFRITIVKDGGATKIGLDVVPDKNKNVLIRKLKEGLISQWNVANPNFQVRDGDYIGEVNGVDGDFESMLAVVAKDQTLEMLILPGS